VVLDWTGTGVKVNSFWGGAYDGPGSIQDTQRYVLKLNQYASPKRVGMSCTKTPSSPDKPPTPCISCYGGAETSPSPPSPPPPSPLLPPSPLPPASPPTPGSPPVPAGCPLSFSFTVTEDWGQGWNGRVYVMPWAQGALVELDWGTSGTKVNTVWNGHVVSTDADERYVTIRLPSYDTMFVGVSAAGTATAPGVRCVTRF